MKTVTISDLWRKFESLSNRRKVAVLRNALGNMKCDRDRSEIYCIAIAMGYEEVDGGYKKEKIA